VQKPLKFNLIVRIGLRFYELPGAGMLTDLKCVDYFGCLVTNVPAFLYSF
jgi:hypothetical protein